MSRRTGRLALWLVVAVILARAHVREQTRYLPASLPDQEAIRSLAGELLRVRPSLPSKSRVLLVNDPLGGNEHNALFLVRLLYRDDTIEVDRAKLKPEADPASYRHVLHWRNGKLIERNGAALRNSLTPAGEAGTIGYRNVF